MMIGDDETMKDNDYDDDASAAAADNTYDGCGGV